MNIPFLRTESYKRGIVLSVGFNFLAKALSLVTSLVVAFYFGTSARMDIYLYAFFAVTIAAGFLSSLNSSVIIPESMRIHEQEGREKSMAFVNLFLYAYAAIGLAVTLLLLVSPVRLVSAVSKFDPGLLAENAAILYLAIPLFTLILLSTYLVDILTSRKFFAVPMLTSMTNSLFALCFILGLHAKMGVSSILLGLSCAYLAQLLFLFALMRSSLGWDFAFAPVSLTRHIRRNVLFAQLGNLASAVSAYVPIFMLSGLNAGTVSAMNYGRQVSEFPNAFITAQFSAVAGIKLNELFAKGRMEDINRIFISTARILLFLLTPVSFAVFFFPDWVITVLFRRGTFDLDSVLASAGFLRFFILLLPLYAVNTLIARMFMATQQIAQSFWYQIAFSAALAGLTYVFVGAFGGLGYPAALLVMYTANLAAFVYLARHFFKELDYVSVLEYFIKLLAFNSALIAPALLLFRALPDCSRAINPAICFIFYFLLVLLANHFLRLCSEADDLLLAARTRLFPGSA